VTIAGIVGRARNGKDEVAKAIIKHRPSFQRIGFADQLKALALEIDPVIPTAKGFSGGLTPIPTDEDVRSGAGISTARLSQVVDWNGWENAKDLFPEVRRFLQHLGTDVRKLMGRDAWVDAWQAKLPPLEWSNEDGVLEVDIPADVVVPDTRFLNEADRIRSLGGTIIRVVRPSITSTDTHPSEVEQEGIDAHFTVVNDGTLKDLEDQVVTILKLMGI
jgi:hypothetical protein